KLFAFSLSPEEWDLYKSREKEIQRVKRRIEELSDPADKIDFKFLEDIDENDIFKLLSCFGSFNDAAVARNSVLVNNFLNKIQEEKLASIPASSEHLAVLVTGGFHTTGITQLLKEKKVAYVVLTPRLGKVEGSGTEYLDIFRRDK